MEQQALALKYRPMDFEELIGQEAVSRTLSLALSSKRLSHAYLFSGLRGSGKTSSARIFARALQCENGPSAKPCGVCANCVAANPHKMRHIDIIELDGASSRKIDDIRDLIEQTKYHPNMGRFKIFIIDEVHMLTKEAFNALLKTLEEPPEYVKFILATTDPLKLPATILSRTQHFRFKRISDKSILEHLKNILQKEQITYQEEALNMLIRSGSGSLRDTLTLLDQVIIYSNYNITTESCANMLGLINPQSLNALFECIFKQDREALLREIEAFFEYESEMLLDEMSIFLKDKLLRGEDSRYNTLLIDRFFRILAQAKELLFLGSEDEFVLTLSVFKMLEALKVEQIDLAIENLEKGLLDNLPKQLPNTSTAPAIQEIPPTTNAIPQTQTTQTQPQAESPLETNPKKQPDNERNLAMFALLNQKIYDRNYELGEIFAKEISFVSFENNLLTWESRAQDKNRERLKNSYSIIKNFVLEIFGIQTQIQSINKPIQTPTIQESQEDSTQEKQPKIPQNHQVEQTQTPEIPTQTQNLKTPQAESQTTQPTNDAQTAIAAEVNAALELPLLQSAKELLEIKQIKVRPKSPNTM
ncbi:DNA polymerase III subunit gamma/tau [Helicobacter sp. MIT 05-5294]|uniref:DNA polymerase III subunit gamma/tau n=1 Tax=Helicobacter sp. MIT 05-5294 TaxID=1548150 RepID=UPI00051FBEA9|nr:DNA polymerase III subunit gamma/tau [Helicobacter sp. MIT 05-5294]TLD86723.1 DNA polymerase III subunit gamma/tau [Helicobacter sp. MIT 05-5294]